MKYLARDQVTLGFIGLGNMGSRISQRLLGHGYQLSVYDMNLAKAETIATQGGTVANSIRELASTVDVVLSCLTNDEAVRTVYNAAEGVFAGARPGTVVLEMSTISPDTSRQLHTLAVRGGIQLLDVAISGSTPAAEQGTLTLLVGGDEDLFSAAEPIFQAVAKRYFLLGGAGSGTAMKLVVNTLLGVGMQAIAEAVVLGEKIGLNRGRLLKVLSETAVVAPAHLGKLASAAVNDYRPQFPLRLMNKDLALILTAAVKEHVSMPATEAAFYVNSEELSSDDDQDFSAVLRRMEQAAGLEATPSDPVTG